MPAPSFDDVQFDPALSAQPAETADTNDSAFERGLRSGATAAQGQLHADLGRAAESVGLRDAAAEHYARSKELEQQAATEGPAISRASDVHGLRDAYDYATGQIGSALPVVGAGLATGLVAKSPVGKIAAGALGAAPFTVGGQIQAQQADPVQAAQPLGLRNAAALAVGGGQALAQNIVPQVVAGRVAGRVAGTVAKESLGDIAARNLAEGVAGNAAAGAGSEYLGQQGATALNPNRDTSGDQEALKEAAIGGGVVGLPFAAAGTAGEALHSRARAATDDVASAVGGAGRAALQSIKDIVSGKGTEPTDLADARKVAEGGSLVDEDKLATATSDGAADLLKQAAATSFDKASAWAKDLYSDNLTPENRAKLDAAVGDLADKGNQAIVAGLKVAQDGYAKAADAATRVMTAFSEKGDEGGKALSEGDSGPRLAVANALTDVLGDPQQAASQARAVQVAIDAAQTTGKFNARQQAAIVSLLGDDARNVLSQVHDRVASGDAARTENFYKAMQGLADHEFAESSLRDTVASSLQPEVRDSVSDVDMQALVNHIRDFVAEKHTGNMTRTEAELHKADVYREMQNAFGDKTDQVLAKFADEQRGNRPIDDRIEHTDNEQGAEAFEQSRYYGGGKDEKNPQFVERPDVHRAKFGNESQAERLLKQAKHENPDRSVDYVSAKDYAADKGLTDAELRGLTDNRPDDHVLVEARGAKDEARLTKAELDGMRLDTKKYPESKSRVDTPQSGTTFDAVRMTEHMKKVLGYNASDEKGGLQRTARAFYEAVAAASDAIGHKIDVKDTTVVDRRGTTVADLKKVSLRPADPDWMKGKTDEQINAELAQRENLRDMSDSEVKRAANTLELRTENEAQRRIDELKGSGVRLSKENVGAIYKAVRESPAGKALKLAEGEVQLRAKGEGDGVEVGKDEQIHTAAAAHSEKDLARHNKLSDKGSLLKQDDSLSREGRQAISSRIAALEAGPTAISRALGVKGRMLEARLDSMSKMDQQRMARLAAMKDVTKVADVINELVKKYPEAPKKSLVSRVNEGGKSLDEVLTRVRSTQDYSALKDSVTQLLDAKRTDHVDKVVDAINKRLETLLRDNPQAQYDYLKEHMAGGAERTAKLDQYILGDKFQSIKDADSMQRFLSAARGRLEEVRAALRSDEDPSDFQHLQDLRTRLEEMFAKDSDMASFFDGMKPTEAQLAAAEALKGKQAAHSDVKGDASVDLSPEQRATVEDIIKTRLGDSVKTEFAKMLHAGEFEKADKSKTPDAKDILRVSVHSLDPTGVAYHESMHAFMEQLRASGGHDINKVLFTAADTHVVRAQLRELLKDEPAALKQIEHSAEERAAYMYQFHEQGLLKLGPKTEGVLGKIQEFFRRVLGTWSNDERALHIMKYFSEGEYAKNLGDRNAISAELTRGTNPAIEKAKAMTAGFRALSAAISGVGEVRIRDTGNPALIKLADLIHSPTSRAAAGGDTGFINSARVARTRVMNDLSNKLAGINVDKLNEALEAMQKGEQAGSPEGRIAQREIQKVLRSTHEYLREAGVDIGDLGKNYFPRVWDVDTLSKKPAEFRAMLQKYKDSGAFKGDIEQVLNRLMRQDGSESGVETVMPGVNASKTRVLSFISGEDAAPFLNKNLHETLNNYVTQATRRAEWSRRFGDDNGKMEALFKEARAAGANDDDIATARSFVNGVNGTLGDNLNPRIRRLFGNMLVYQNIRLLPLAIFSSVIDPAGIVVRGGSVSDAFRTFKRGIAEIPRGFKRVENQKEDAGYKLAQDLGVIDSAILQHAVGSAYSQGMVGGTGKKINDTFFRFNLMEQFNQSMRVGATVAAKQFLAKHAASEGPHSERWLAELGLKKGDVVMKDGEPLLTINDFIDAGHAPDVAAAKSNQMALAVNKWVDGAVLRPNAAQKPIWMNDPHWALVAHLKQFVYSFQENIIKRTVNEAQHGNYSPALALASYVPIMVAADLAKGIIQGGGQQPSWKEGWDAGDYVWSGVQRAGLLGGGQFVSDAVSHKGGLAGLAGPTIEQLADVVNVAGGREQFGSFVLKSMPANATYAAIAGATATDPTFAD